MDKPYKLRRPKGLEDYILKVCAEKTYLIFDHKADICVCTRCKTEKQISKMNDAEFLKHNEKHWCYECNEGVICKEKRYGRKNIADHGRILWLQKRGKATFAQLDEYTINYYGGDIPSVEIWESAQYKFTKEQEYYKHKREGWWTGERWIKRNDIKLPSAESGMFCVSSKFEATYFYEPSRNSLGTYLKYANLDMKRLGYEEEKEWEAYLIIGYMHNFLKYKSIELLEKSGFTHIVKDKIKGEGCRDINWRGDNLTKILKRNNGEIKELRTINPGIETFEEIIQYQKSLPWISIADYNIYDKICRVYNLKDYKKEVAEYIDVRTAFKYLEKQNMRLGDYIDYLKECDQLGMDMKDKRVLKPKNLKEAHELTSSKIEICRDELTKKNFKRYQYQITGMTEPYINGDYLIRPAESTEELNIESKSLHHCVRTYAEKVAKGSTSILFIRKIKEPDKPLYTIELNKEHKVVQCRGLHNSTYPEDVKEFINSWLKEVINKKPKKGKKVA